MHGLNLEDLEEWDRPLTDDTLKLKADVIFHLLYSVSDNNALTNLVPQSQRETRCQNGIS
jgi:hypothetical protein